MSDKYGECYCGDCISFNKCKSDKGTRINLVSEGCSCFEPNDIAEFDYPILPKWLAEHEKQVREDVIKPIQKFIDDYDGAIIISENMGVISGQQLINELKEIVEQLKGAGG